MKYRYVELSKTKLNQKYENMKERCSEWYWDEYDESYRGSILCDEWLYDKYAFYDWCNDGHYYKIDGEKECHLDKDVLCRVKGYDQKIYSPETCLFLPAKLNLFLGGCHANNKTGLPMGVIKVGADKYKLQKHYRIEDIFDTPEEAYEVAKIHTDAKKIVMVDEYYRAKKIPKKVYDAVMQYEFRIND